MGGEKLNLPTPGTRSWGSPPRGRGKGSCKTRSLWFRRITPAWAGKRLFETVKTTITGDHPRVGGEKSGSRKRARHAAGSPPRGRGKVLLFTSFKLLNRITPAWAGKRATRSAAGSGSGDHPRVGGEKLSSGAYVAKDKGSPPRGRGKDKEHPPLPGAGRITPAWAGKSTSSTALTVLRRDHPRMGGEKRMVSLKFVSSRGSPPHRRGKARHLSHGLLPCG